MLDNAPDTFTLPSTYMPTPLQLPPIGASCHSWGDPRRGWGTRFNSTDVARAFEVLNDAGVTLFDTSEVFGYQGQRLAESSEQLLGELVSSSLKPPLVSSKFMPVPWANLVAGGGLRLGRRAVLRAVRNSIARLGVGSIDIYSLHAPLPFGFGRRAVYEGLAEAYDLGLCRGVGVCEFNTPLVREAHAACSRLGVPLLMNQVRYSLLNIERELDGTIETCLELGIAPVADSPLASGLLTGQYAHAMAHRRGRRGRVGRFQSRQLLVLSHMYEVMADIANEGESRPTGPTGGPFPGGLGGLGGMGGGGPPMSGPLGRGGFAPPLRARARTETQVALRFAMAKGCTPMPGVNNAAHAEEVAGALDWDLELDELHALSERALALHLRRGELPWLRRV